MPSKLEKYFDDVAKFLSGWLLANIVGVIQCLATAVIFGSFLSPEYSNFFIGAFVVHFIMIGIILVSTVIVALSLKISEVGEITVCMITLAISIAALAYKFFYL